jgi:hypothetical protein
MCYDRMDFIQETEKCVRSLFLSSYLAFVVKNGYIAASMASAYANQLQSMQGMGRTSYVTW